MLLFCIRDGWSDGRATRQNPGELEILAAFASLPQAMCYHLARYIAEQI